MVMDVDEEHQNVPTSCASCLYRSANPCCLGMTSPSPRKLAKSIVFLASSARRSLLRRRRRSAWWSETILRQSFKRSFASYATCRSTARGPKLSHLNANQDESFRLHYANIRSAPV